MAEGLIRIRGRLSDATTGDRVSLPIVLPKDHPITQAIIIEAHQQLGQAGVAHTLADVRNRYWVLNGGAVVKRFLRKCLICRRQNAIACGQQMSSLPEWRITAGWFPFQHVGLDYFGPIHVKRGRGLEKRYGCLFTCLQCRAIHLEIAQSLSTESFILTLMRFINRRGTPQSLHSDNGSNFIDAERELKEWLVTLDQERIHRKLANSRIEWHFNPPLASHRGGMWERMIRSVRKILSSLAFGRSLDEETLWTYLTYAERIVNDRLLTPVRDGVEEPKPLSPNDLLNPRNSVNLRIDMPLEQLADKRWRQVNRMITEFWNKWKREYLDTLQVRQRWLGFKENLKVGDLVIVETESTPRMAWPLGIVAEVKRRSDGLVRTADVRTSKGLVKQDIRKLYWLQGADIEQRKV
jgi:transposase InsO family protein